MSAKTSSLKYELLLLLMSMIWGSTFAAQQIGMSKGLGPMTFNALRFTLGCIALLPVIFWRKKHQPDQKQPVKIPIFGCIAAGIFLFAAAGLQQIGLQYTSSANAGFITGFYLLFVPLLGMLVGHKAGKSLWVGIAFCLIGLYFLSINENLVMSKGDFLIFICAILWAIQILIIDNVANKGDPIQIACIQFAVCSLLSSIAAGIFESFTIDQVIAGAPAVVYAGVMSVGIAFTLQVICQKKCPPGPAAIIMSTEAVFAAITGYIVLDQTLTLRALAGCSLIFAGMLIVQLTPIVLRKRVRRLKAIPPID